MAILDALVTSAAGALFATAGVLVAVSSHAMPKIASGCETSSSLPTTNCLLTAPCSRWCSSVRTLTGVGGTMTGRAGARP